VAGRRSRGAAARWRRALRPARGASDRAPANSLEAEGVPGGRAAVGIEELEHFRDLLDSGPDAVVVVRGVDEIAFVNQRAEALFGYARDELIGQSVNLLVPERFRTRHARARTGYHSEARARQAGPGLELYGRRSDGSEFPVEISLNPLETGGEMLFSSWIRDVTERRQLEADLRASREQALAASRSKSEFVANMSHEIRTPLNGVVCMLDLLLAGGLDDCQRQYGEIALTSAETLLALINDILDFSKIEAGRLEVLDEDFAIAATLHEACAIVGSAAREKGLEMEVSIDAEVPELVRGDRQRLRQVLVNLLGNAVKFTAQGRVSVAVARSRGAEHLLVEVSDTGIGIEPAQLARLFEAFAQADASTTRTFGGSGLGLSIAKQLVELMGGKIGARSKPGVGSTFWFTVACHPHRGLADPAAAARAHHLAGERGYTTAGHPSGAPRAATDTSVESVAANERPTVLLAEDNEINRFAAAQVLRKLGCVVELARNGREAIEMTAQKDYAAVFMDCQMPELDGYAAASAIRRREAGGRHTPIVALTAHAMVGDREKCLAAGMDDYVTKPLRIGSVAEALARVPETHRAPPAAHRAEDGLFDPAQLFETTTLEQTTELVGQFLELLSTSVSRLADAIEAGDRDELRSVAHTLKGTAACAGAPAVIEACEAICAAAPAADPQHASALQLRLAETATATAAAMRAYVAEISCGHGRVIG
jgi:PAS domain S-box-containing protein